MGKKFISLMTRCTLMLAVAAGAAAAAFRQHANVAFTATKSGKIDGHHRQHLLDLRPQQAAQGGEVADLDVPTGTRFNLGRVKACTRSGKQLTTGKSCPSEIGTGSAVASPYPLPDVHGKVRPVAAGQNKMTLLVTVTKPVEQIVVIHATTSGSTLKVSVPTPTVAGD